MTDLNIELASMTDLNIELASMAMLKLLQFRRNPKYLCFNTSQILSARTIIADAYINAYDDKCSIILENGPLDFEAGDETAKLYNILSYEIFIQCKFQNLWKYLRDIVQDKEQLNINIYSKFDKKHEPYDPFDEFDHIFNRFFCSNKLMMKYLMSNPNLYEPLLLFTIKILKHELLHYVQVYGALFSLLMDTVRYFKKKHIVYLLKNELAESVAIAIVTVYNASFSDQTYNLKVSQSSKEHLQSMIWEIIISLSFVVRKRMTKTVWKQYVLSIERSLCKQTNKSRNKSLKNNVNEYKHHLRAMGLVDYSNRYQGILNGFCSDQSKCCAYLKCKRYQLKQKQKRLKICKGCKLMYYCCRKHQKKDWKLVHSEQCLRNHLLC